ncbi:hypothetical protein GGS23DRAFT_458137 [Durotheca rogersii]|uniref:uncharacterized protein n=1 Tax=Durotheca rogersii TaxID=419775 RepID=UPI00221F0E28|nr:uncharacterized protein GGS23DRAFT_458137 [Durotheca rogersii]KAI5864650.1 hypothetical protein GGS23DRAFT_458137 [Durotheca rogersii]
MGSAPQPTKSPAPSPAKGKAAATKKTSGGVTKRAGRKPAAKKATRGKGRGQKKSYPEPFAQASYERQRELRDLFSQVSIALKPALDEIADQTIKALTQDIDAHKAVPEYEILQRQLDGQLQNVIEAADKELHMRVKITDREHALENTRTERAFMDSYDYRTEEFYDGALNRTSILAELRREGRALDTPDLTYNYVEPSALPVVMESDGSEAAAEDQGRKTKLTGKRRVDDQSDGRTDSKKPRHVAGLLSSEKEPDGRPESREPSPSALDDQESGVSNGKDFPDLPNGASEADEWGVRAVNRRAKSPYNRFIVPQTFQFEDHEIGFRDSTNDSTRKATRATRGRFLNEPNSRNFHWDHTVRDYDCREYKEDALDTALTKKHVLHPRYGFPMPDSENEAEPPGERVDGTRPVVVVPSATVTIHASRSVRPKKMDNMLKEDATKSTTAMMLADFCAKEGINPDEIVTDEMRDRERQARERLTLPPDEDDNGSGDNGDGGEAAVEEHSPRLSIEAYNGLVREHVNMLLQAASQLEQDKPAPPTSTQRSSRPYDAVRDVFTSAEPAPARPELPMEGHPHGLSILADAALGGSQQLIHTDVAATSDSSMIDPRLLGLFNPPPQPNAFLQTALNPSPSFAHIAPSPASSMEPMQPTVSSRIPFTGQANARDSPILPPLRPNRSDGLGKGSNGPPLQQPPPPPIHRPQEFGSPHGLLHTNSGNFYPPAPSRAYHQSYSFHEPALMPVPQQVQPFAGPGMIVNPHAPPPHLAGYPVMSSSLQGQPHMGSMSSQMEIPQPSVSPPGPPMLGPSSPMHTPRHRASMASNGSGSGSGKYRKIAAAPIPHNRPWPGNGATELRLAHYDHKEAIKDYRANEPPPRSGPTTIRGWNVNNGSKGRNRSVKKEDSEEKDSPK